MRYSQGYDSRPRRRIGETVDTLPEVIAGMRRVMGWLEVCAKNGVVVPASELEDLRRTVYAVEAVFAQANR